jgi:hypothetical protein
MWLSLEKAVGIPDAIHRSGTALATIVVRTIFTSSVELIALWPVKGDAVR